MERTPPESQRGEARGSADFLAEDTADEEDQQHQRDGSSAPVLDVRSVPNAGSFSLDFLDLGHRVLITPPGVVPIPLAASGALQAPRTTRTEVTLAVSSCHLSQRALLHRCCRRRRR
ncbi:hypothetical_protein [Leishmania major strain Friedlin]|nr:hypothetical_protein [Leishmania major strain Friedlin]